MKTEYTYRQSIEADLMNAVSAWENVSGEKSSVTWEFASSATNEDILTLIDSFANRLKHA